MSALKEAITKYKTDVRLSLMHTHEIDEVEAKALVEEYAEAVEESFCNGSPTNLVAQNLIIYTVSDQ